MPRGRGRSVISRWSQIAQPSATCSGAAGPRSWAPSRSFGKIEKLPIARGEPAVGTWQGIYLCEFRDHGGARRLIATLHGED